MTTRSETRTWVGCSRDMLVYLFAMSGIFLRKPSRLRVAVSTVIVGAMAWSLLSGFRPTLVAACVAFALGYVIRYTFLFWSFTKNGIATHLTRRLGSERGFRAYEALTAVQFSYRAMSFSWLVAATSVDISGPWATSIRGVGLVVAAVGTIVNLWATDVIGVRSYFYGDLYDGPRAQAIFKAEGPYRHLANPMYGLGQCGGYGAAMMGLSPVGMIATLGNQLSMYVFNALVEQPHVSAVLRLGVLVPASTVERVPALRAAA